MPVNASRIRDTGLRAEIGEDSPVANSSLAGIGVLVGDEGARIYIRGGEGQAAPGSGSWSGRREARV
jgi:hypothetical protein